jgi:hypothetical protein
MAIERSFPNVDKLRDSLKATVFKEAGRPGKIETAVVPPAYSYLAELKELANSLGFTFVNDSFLDMICFAKGNWRLFLYTNPTLAEVIPTSDIIYVMNTGHKTYFQWNLVGGGLDIRGLTPGQLFFAIKG